jgi:DNA-binding PucR family transcriptional regulator
VVQWIESARASYIHPNTLGRRLGQIEELIGPNLDEVDLLSLQVAVKLVRLQRQPWAAA